MRDVERPRGEIAVGASVAVAAPQVAVLDAACEGGGEVQDPDLIVEGDAGVEDSHQGLPAAPGASSARPSHILHRPPETASRTNP